MSKFNNMTLVAAVEVIGGRYSHGDLSKLETEWGVQGRCDESSKSKRIADLACIALEEDPEVITIKGRQPLSRALIEEALTVPGVKLSGPIWEKLIAGLRFDGFEVCEESEPVPDENFLDTGQKRLVLRQMLPQDMPDLDFRDAENELVALLDKHEFKVTKGHLAQATAAFSRGDWAAANAQFRSFFESLLDEIATKLGFEGNGGCKAKRRYLGELEPPFLLSRYNEWNRNPNKHQFVQGLMSRLHPHGSHPGLSEEDDCAFRMQIALIAARLFLRRFDKRET